MTRKYRQQGYMDREKDRDREKRRDRGPKIHKPEFRSPNMPGFQEVVRCSSCGSVLPKDLLDIAFDSQCANCSADLHVCKNCVSFDTSSRLECREPILERVSPKDRKNSCTHFEARRTIERQTGSTPASSSAPSPPEDPRAAFDRLFKK